MSDTQKASVLPIDRDRKSSGETSDIFRLLVESIRDYAIFVLDPDGNVLTWNPGAQAMKGYAKDEIVGQHFSKFYPPEAIQSGWPQRELSLARKEGRFADEGWRIRKDGSAFWASVIITALHGKDGEVSGFAKVTQDLTQRRHAEDRVQGLNRELRQRISQLNESQRIIELRTLELQKLSADLLNIQDEERRRIARELHDDIGQQLVVLKMAIPKLLENESALKAADGVAASVRSISYLLHPPLLDEAGLRAALHWYIEGLSERTKIEISLTINPPFLSRFSKDIETTIFRVVQESLTNVYRHAGSDSARVEIDKQAEWVVIRVRDYGKGVSPELLSHGSSAKLGVGITGMRERLRQLGGELTVSRAQPGTVVEARIPLFLGETPGVITSL